MKLYNAILRKNIINIFILQDDANKNVTELAYMATHKGSGAHYEYDTFGNIITNTRHSLFNFDSNNINPFRFSSEYHDDELSLIYYNYRHYNPQTGRWISRDPIEEQGGNNLYNFVKNNTLNQIDILGLRIISTLETNYCLGDITNVSGESVIRIGTRANGEFDKNTENFINLFNAADDLMSFMSLYDSLVNNPSDIISTEVQKKLEEKLHEMGVPPIAGFSFDSLADILKGVDATGKMIEIKKYGFFIYTRVQYDICVCKDKKKKWDRIYTPWKRRDADMEKHDGATKALGFDSIASALRYKEEFAKEAAHNFINTIKIQEENS